MPGSDLESLLAHLPAYRDAAEAMREMVLSNAVQIGEIPAPTFQEEQRIRFLRDRFSECGLSRCSCDEVGNGLGFLPGSDGRENILVVAHADTTFPATVDHTVTVAPDSISGPGIGDNSLGLAVIASLPTLLAGMGVQYKSNLILMGAVRSLGRGDLEGLRFFLANHREKLRAGLCLEGVQLGRVSIRSIGMLRGHIRCRVPVAYDWTRFGAAGAILTINEVINKLNRIAIPRRPRTRIVLGSIHGGETYNAVADQALLRFEIRSESAEIVDRIHRRIEEIVEEISTETESEVALEIIAHRQPGGIAYRHPLSRRTRQVLRSLGVDEHTSPSTSELSTFIDRGIPAVTVGVTSGEHHADCGEKIYIDPIAVGIAQVVGVLRAIDEGYCDEH